MSFGIRDAVMGWGDTQMGVSPEPDVLRGWSWQREKALGEWDEPFPKIRQFFFQQGVKGDRAASARAFTALQLSFVSFPRCCCSECGNQGLLGAFHVPMTYSL